MVGASGASGMPLLIQCLKLIRAAGRSSVLIMSDSAVLTLRQETGSTPEDLAPLVDAVYGPGEVGAPPASGSWPAAGMLVVPCSMKTAAGICAGYADNLLLRAAAARETPMSAIHLRNLHELAMLPTVRIIPPMLTFYHKPETIDEMVYHIAAKLVEPFGVEAKEYRRWQGL